MTTILLVDGDPLQASVRTSALETRFDVRRAADPADALIMVEQSQFAGRLALVIADLHIHGISGPAFVAEIHARLPGVPVLVLGGVRELPADYNTDGVRFLPEPIASDEILNVASQMLAA